jgi:hypothetical protein
VGDVATVHDIHVAYVADVVASLRERASAAFVFA